MVLSHFLTKYTQPNEIAEDFNVTQWNIANPDFYVPPHPLLYLFWLKPKTFLLVLATNLVLPYKVSHFFQIIILAASIILQPIQGLQVLPHFFWKAIYIFTFYSMKAFEWQTLISLLEQAHVNMTNYNVYYWILNVIALLENQTEFLQKTIKQLPIAIKYKLNQLVYFLVYF